jgi:hypothetical protein
VANLARELARDGRTVVLRADDTDLVILSPARRRRRSVSGATPVLPLPRYPKGGVVAATAGAVRYDGPVLSREQEREAFELGVAAEALESLGE